MTSDHPDIAAALVTGYPAGAFSENKDTLAAQREYAEERMKEFIAFALDGDPDILESFARHSGYDYKNWLN